MLCKDLAAVGLELSNDEAVAFGDFLDVCRGVLVVEDISSCRYGDYSESALSLLDSTLESFYVVEVARAMADGLFLETLIGEVAVEKAWLQGLEK